MDKLISLAMHANARPPVVLRVDTDRLSVAEAIERLTAAGVRSAAHRNGISIVIDQPLDVASLDLFTEGLLSPQDAMASAVVASAAITPGMRVVDLCSSPGTKTVQIAQRMHNEGRIAVLDVSNEKLEPVKENCRRVGTTIVETMLAPQAGALADGSWDLVLVDAPCSNTGVLCRRPEARWRFTRKMLGELSTDQRHLLLLAAQMVRSGGRLLYSTCSMEAEENAQVVAFLLSREKTFRLVKQEVIWPGGLDDAANWNDGGFFAILRRT
jgi:16S rRNA (cytosine967-C5)-methyltransferase